MSDYLTTLRKKPKAVRNNIALGAAGVCTLPILLYVIFGIHGTKPAVVADAVAVEQTTPFKTFWGELREQLASVQSAVGTTSPAAVVTAPAAQTPVIVVPQSEVRNATTTFGATSTASE